MATSGSEPRKSRDPRGLHPGLQHLLTHHRWQSEKNAVAADAPISDPAEKAVA